MALTDFQTSLRITTLLQSEDGMDGYAALWMDQDMLNLILPNERGVFG